MLGESEVEPSPEGTAEQQVPPLGLKSSVEMTRVKVTQ
jgi:hypothetical protein